jgi:hypothetical protein
MVASKDVGFFTIAIFNSPSPEASNTLLSNSVEGVVDTLTSDVLNELPAPDVFTAHIKYVPSTDGV